MILANISTFEGQCSDAEHYYCSYNKIVLEDLLPPKQCECGENELKRTITSKKEADYLNKKDGWSGWRVGLKTIKFNSIEQIHKELKKKFKNQTIVTYYERKLFKDMLCFKNGENLGFKAFGETWSYVPTSCYKHILPPLNEIKIKCDECGKEYKLEDVSRERPWTEGRILLEFFQEHRRREMKKPHCKCFYLVWNVVF